MGVRLQEDGTKYAEGEGKELVEKELEQQVEVGLEELAPSGADHY